MVNLLDHLDIDYPSVADRQDQPTEPAFLQAREGVEQEYCLSVADAARQVHHRALHRLHPPDLCTRGRPECRMARECQDAASRQPDSGVRRAPATYVLERTMPRLF